MFGIVEPVDVHGKPRVVALAISRSLSMSRHPWPPADVPSARPCELPVAKRQQGSVVVGPLPSVHDEASLLDWSRNTGRRLLQSAEPRRWSHSQQVARRAVELASVLEVSEVVAIVAYLHDIGYSPEICKTGLHPLDGARHLRTAGAPETVLDLVAHHTSADAEAAERGLCAQLSEFADPPDKLSDQLTYTVAGVPSWTAATRNRLQSRTCAAVICNRLRLARQGAGGPQPAAAASHSRASRARTTPSRPSPTSRRSAEGTSARAR